MTKKRPKKPIKVGFVALGCPKNVVDSEKMLARIAEAGLVISGEPEQADVVVINTCGFIAPAKAEALETIEHFVRCKKTAGVKKIVVAGCLSQRLGRELFAEVDGIDAVVGLGERDDIADIIVKTVTAEKPIAYLAHSCKTVSDDKARLLITSRHWAYLRISEGCDHRCSFCTIPAIRGRFRSKQMEDILAEAAELAAAGVVELNVIAQDTGYYGKDIGLSDGLVKLLRELEKIEPLKWIRLMYLYPVGITDKLIETVAGSKKIVPYFDMPIQHISNPVLKAMCRPDTKERICGLIEKLRRDLPEIVLRTTVIVGFPGETAEQFKELIDFIKWARFDALGGFTYYPEPGTDAAEMPGQIPDDVKQQRLDELMLTQQQIAFDKNSQRVGSEITCLIDSVDSDGTATARYYGQAPDIDSICIKANCKAAAGQFIDARVAGTRDYDLIVE